jgi:hypothetical protein
MTPPTLEHVCDVDVSVDVPIAIGETGAGLRRIVAIKGGVVKGPAITGRVLDAGADFQVLRADGSSFLEARYALDIDGHGLVYVENNGLRCGAPDVMEKLARGEAVDPALIYFRSVPKFETAAPGLQWMMRHVFIGVGTRYPDRVQLSVWMLK